MDPVLEKKKEKNGSKEGEKGTGRKDTKNTVGSEIKRGKKKVGGGISA